jgi:branched-chain amino acid transport system permease protein
MLEHVPIARAGLLHRLLLPYLRILLPGLIMVLGFVGMVELLSFLTIGMAEGKQLALLGRSVDVFSAAPWLFSLLCLAGGCIWLAIEARRFKRIWDGLMEIAARQ